MPVFEMSMEELQQYTGCSPKPENFDAYWLSALNSCRETGLDYAMQPADFQADGVECYDLWFIGVRGAKIHCKYMKPAGINKKIPGVVSFHGYMHHSGEWYERLPLVYSGKAVLVMECRGQGGTSEDVYHGVGPTAFGLVIRGVRDKDPQMLYYRDVYLDAVKAVWILMDIPYVDENRIGVYGKSQGGALSVAAAALEPKVKLCAPIYPFLSDFCRILEMDLAKDAYEGFYWLFKKCDPTHAHEKDYLYRMGYVDIQNLAPWIQGRVLWQSGLMDTQCPPSTQFAAYNKIKAPKDMILYPDHSHELIYYANDAVFSFFDGL